MEDRTIALLLSIAPLCAFAFAGLFMETIRLYRINKENKS